MEHSIRISAGSSKFDQRSSLNDSDGGKEATMPGGIILYRDMYIVQA